MKIKACLTTLLILFTTIVYSNNPPIAVDDWEMALQDGIVTLRPSENDKGSFSSLSITVPANNGILAVNQIGGGLDYTPNASYLGADSFEYEICDNSSPALCDRAIFTLAVLAEEDMVFASSDYATTVEDTPVVIACFDNDQGILDPGSLKILNNPEGGVVLVNANDDLVYQPNPDFGGSDSFAYAVCSQKDSTVCDMGLVFIAISEEYSVSLNTISDEASTLIGTAVIVDVLKNDSYYSSDVIDSSMLTLASSPGYGVATILPDKTIQYTPDFGYEGNDSFNYEICSFMGVCREAAVLIDVREEYGLYDIRFSNDSIDQQNMKYYADISISVPHLKNNFRIADQLYSFSFPTNALANPQVEAGLSISGITAQYSVSEGYSYSVYRKPQIVVADSIATIEIKYVGGEGYDALNINYNDVVRVSFDILDLGACLELEWLEKGATNGPGTELEEIINGMEFIVEDRDYYTNTNCPAITTNSDTAETPVNLPIAIDVLANDSDVNGNGSLMLGTPGDNGVFSITSTNKILYMPDLDFLGTDTFSYFLCDNGTPQFCAEEVVAVEVIDEYGQFDLRFTDQVIDCENMLFYVDVELKASSAAHVFYLWDQNLKFGFSTGLANPQIDAELEISGTVQQSGDYTTSSVYDIHTLTGTTADEVSYNIIAGSGDGYRLDENNFVKVGRIKFDIIDENMPIGLTWSDAVGGIESQITESRAGSYLLAATGVEEDLEINLGLNISLFLEGPYNPSTGLMNTSLNDYGLLPGQIPNQPSATATPAGQPYNMPPFNYPGTQSILNYDATVVDWVLISYVEEMIPTSSPVIFHHIGLLHNDGRVEVLEPADIPTNHPVPLYVKIEHRNHMAVLSPEAHDLSCSFVNIDFRIEDSFKFPTSFGQKQLPDGTWVAYGGDLDQEFDIVNYDINGSDNVLWEIYNGNFNKYLNADANMDGVANALDKVLWSRNNGIANRVPKE